LNEDDTARALRKIPYAEIKDLANKDKSFEHLSSDQKKEFLDRYGWTHDELIKALLDELDNTMKDL